MLNINGKLLEELDESEYYLFSILLNYGTKSHPKNDVLERRTGWGESKLKRVKKNLKDKGFIKVNARYGGEKGRGRKSNQYVIKTKLASKYNGVKQDDFNTYEIKLDEINTVEINTDDFKPYEKEGGFKVLKVSIIESIKLLKEESEKALTQEKENLLSEFKKLQAENERLNLELKNKSEAQKEKPKSSAKKVKAKHEFPTNEPRKSYKANANGFPSMEQFDEIPKHEQQIKKNYELEISKFTYPDTWSEYLISQFLEWCAGQDEKLKGKFGATHVKALIRKINGHLKSYDAKTIGDSIELSLSTAYNNFNPQWIIDRENKKKQDAAKQQANSAEGLYESWARIVDEGISPNGNANGSNTVDTSWADA